MTDAHPCTATSSVIRAQTTQPISANAANPRNAPNTAISRSGRVPDVSTILQKWDASRRFE